MAILGVMDYTNTYAGKTTFREAISKTAKQSANLTGYITCQQTNQAFENPDSSWYFHRNGSQNEGKTQDKAQLFDTEYRDFAVLIMEQARERFLTAFKNFGYKKGAATGIHGFQQIGESGSRRRL